MKIMKSIMYASVALGAVAVAVPALAQEQSGDKGDTTVVVVTATKRKESLQSVPMSVDAVTGDTLSKLNVQKFEDVQKLSPGLVLNPADGRGQNVSLRGVTFDPDTGASPTVQVYWNETPISTSDAFRSLFDVSQIEVLRGPQGTLRGQTSPAGAITIATQRPSLHSFEGMFNQTIGSRAQWNTQAGVSIPLIDGKLAIRLAGVYDYSENGVHNVVNNRDDSDMAHGGRVSVLWKPVSSVEVLLVHQQLNDTNVNYPVAVGAPVTGQGAGPTLTAANRSSVIEGPYDFRNHSQLTSLNVTWDLGGHRLSYIGGLQQGREEDLRDLDITNVISGWNDEQDVSAKTRQVSHELRFESTGPSMWTWMVGAYYSKNTGSAVFTQPLAYYFYAPYQPPLQTPLTGSTDPGNYGQNMAIFTDHRFALTPSDTVEVGLRYQENKSQNQQYLSYFGLTAPSLSADLTHLSNHGLTGSVNYKHSFDKDTMAYVSYSKGLRPGGAVGFITAVGLDPHYYIYQPETTDSYELGFKSKLFDRRVTLNADIFQQNIHNYIARANATWVRTAAVAGEPNGTGPGGTYGADLATGGINFNTNGDVVSKGVEATVSWLISANWNAQLSAAYIDAHYDNALLYCNDSNNDGIPDNGGAYVQPGRQVSLCKSNRPLQDTFGNEAGKLNMTLRSEYAHQLGKYEGFVRGLVRYVPPSYNQQLDKHISAYTPVDLYVGVRNPNQKWELSLWAQNLLDKSVDRGLNALYAGGLAGGYLELRTPPEERRVGATLRYRFGG